MISKSLNLPRFARVIDDNYAYHDVLILDAVKQNQKGAQFIEFYRGWLFVKADTPGYNATIKPIKFNNYPQKGSLYMSKGITTHIKYSLEIGASSIVKFYGIHVNVKPNTSDTELVQEFEAFQKAQEMGKLKDLDVKYQDSTDKHNFAKLNSLNDALQKSKCYECIYKKEHVSGISNTQSLRTKMREVEKKLKECETVFGFEETDKMLKVLRELNFISSSNIPQIKTRVARELGGGVENLYITELLMQNILDKLEAEEIVPVISIFVAQARSKDEIDPESIDVPESLKDALRRCQDIYTAISEAERKANIEGSDANQPIFLLVKPLYEWAKGKDFVDITEHTDVLEGAIVRTIQRVEQTLRNIKRALTVLGNDTQLQKVEKAGTIIKRDIAFALSLYIDENKDILI